MFRFSRRITIFFIFVGIVAVGSLVASLIGAGGGGVSSDFSDARLQGALIAQKIVDLSNQSSDDLEEINRLDQERKFDEALALTSSMLVRSQEIREQAVALSAEIEKMTRGLSSIESPEARQAALESITSRLTLIGRLINYSAQLANLADALGGRFAGTGSQKKVASVIEQINLEVQAINNFNNQAIQSMDRFDKLIGG